MNGYIVFLSVAKRIILRSRKEIYVYVDFVDTSVRMNNISNANDIDSYNITGCVHTKNFD